MAFIPTSTNALSVNQIRVIIAGAPIMVDIPTQSSEIPYREFLQYIVDAYNKIHPNSVLMTKNDFTIINAGRAIRDDQPVSMQALTGGTTLHVIIKKASIPAARPAAPALPSGTAVSVHSLSSQTTVHLDPQELLRQNGEQYIAMNSDSLPKDINSFLAAYTSQARRDGGNCFNSQSVTPFDIYWDVLLDFEGRRQVITSILSDGKLAMPRIEKTRSDTDERYMFALPRSTFKSTREIAFLGEELKRLKGEILAVNQQVGTDARVLLLVKVSHQFAVQQMGDVKQFLKTKGGQELSLEPETIVKFNHVDNVSLFQSVLYETSGSAYICRKLQFNGSTLTIPMFCLTPEEHKLVTGIITGGMFKGCFTIEKREVVIEEPKIPTAHKEIIDTGRIDQLLANPASDLRFIQFRSSKLGGEASVSVVGEPKDAYVMTILPGGSLPDIDDPKFSSAIPLIVKRGMDVFVGGNTETGALALTKAKNPEIFHSLYFPTETEGLKPLSRCTSSSGTIGAVPMC